MNPFTNSLGLLAACAKSPMAADVDTPTAICAARSGQVEVIGPYRLEKHVLDWPPVKPSGNQLVAVPGLRR